MDYQTFATRKEAKAELSRMRGWDAKVVSMYLPGDNNANKNGTVFVIECDNAKYLRRTGYVQ